MIYINKKNLLSLLLIGIISAESLFGGPALNTAFAQEEAEQAAENAEAPNAEEQEEEKETENGKADEEDWEAETEKETLKEEKTEEEEDRPEEPKKAPMKKTPKMLRKETAETASWEHTETKSTDSADKDGESEKIDISIVGSLPQDVSAKIESAETEEIEIEKEKPLYAYDITLEKDGEEYQPNAPVLVSFSGKPIEKMDAKKEDLHIWHIHDDGEVEEIEDFDMEDGQISFLAPSFSIYVITEHDDTEIITPRNTYHFLAYPEDVTNGIYTSAFYSFPNADGEDINSQIVKDGEYLTEPPNPPDIEEGEEVKRFYGWYFVEKITEENGEVTYRWPASPERYDFFQAVDVTEDGTEYYLAPLYKNLRYVEFHEDEEGGENADRIVQKKLAALNSNGEAEIIVSNVSAPLQNSTHEYFYGWTYLDNSESPAERKYLDLYDETGQAVEYLTLTVNEEMFGGSDVLDLYPVYRSAYWLNFNANAMGSGAVYVPAIFVHSDSSITDLPVTSCSGYTFLGWYTAPQGGTQVTDASGHILGGHTLELTEDTTFYAHWQAQENASEYKVVIWYENADSDDYSYGGIYTVDHVTAAQQTNVTASDLAARGFNKNGFTLDRIQNTTILNDGSSVVNVYYRRNIYSVRFHSSRTANSPVIDDLTIEAKYEEDIHDRWPGVAPGTSDYSSMWYVDTYGSAFVTGITTMPYGGADYYALNSSGYYFDTVYMLQAVDGSNTFEEYQRHPFQYNSQSVTTSVEDYTHVKGFSLNAASASDATTIRNGASTDGSDPDALYDPDFPRSPQIGAYFYSTSGWNGHVGEGVDVTREDGHTYKTMYFYYLRNKYDIRYHENGGPDLQDVEGVYYGASVSGYKPMAYVEDETRVMIDGKLCEFKGWYDNEALQGEPFDFNGKTLDVGGLDLYAKWEPVWFLVQVDPAGGVLSSGDATYMWKQYGSTISRYNTVVRNYIEDENGTFYYHDGLYPDAGRAAYYTTDQSQATSGETYSHEDRAYSLIGWYEVLEDGSIADVPFNFAGIIDRDITIRAVWRRSGTYILSYSSASDAEDTSGNVVSVTGYMTDNNGNTRTRIYDPETGDVHGGIGYADKAEAYIHAAPVGYDTTQWTFVGWRVIGDDRLYSPGDKFIVDEDISRDGIIYLEAVYQPKETSIRIPPTTALILDANEEGEVDPAGLENSDSPGAYTQATAPEGLASVLKEGLWFRKQDINTEIRLSDWKDRFSSENGFFLLGFDEDSEPPTLIPEYAADARLGIDAEGSDNLLYAIWEPQVYVSFVNDTDSTVEFDFDVPQYTAGSVFRVNEVTGIYDREVFTDFSNGTAHISLAAGETLKLVFPDGEGMDLAVDGTSTLTPGNMLDVTSSLGGTVRRTAEDIRSGGAYHIGEVLVKDPDGLVVRFTEEKGKKVTFDTNGGVWNGGPETYTEEGGNHVTYKYLGDQVLRPTDPTREGYAFIGWTTDPSYAGTVIDDINDVPSSALYDFSTPVTEDTTLYAVWAETVRVTFNISYNNSYNHNWQEDDPSYVKTSNSTYVVDVIKGSYVQPPADPAYRNNQTASFLGWHTNNTAAYRTTIYAHGSVPAALQNAMFDFSQPVTEDVTLYTSWTSSALMHVLVKKQANRDGNFTFRYRIRTDTYTFNRTRSGMRYVYSHTGPTSSWSSENTFTLRDGQQQDIVLESWQTNIGNSTYPKYTYVQYLEVWESDLPDGYELISIVPSEAGGTVDLGNRMYSVSSGSVAHAGADNSNNNWQIAETEGHEVLFTNYIPPNDHSLTVTKAVSGNMASRDRKFLFTISLRDSDGNSLTEAPTVTVDGAAQTIQMNGGSFTFRLSDGQTCLIEGIPDSTVYTVTEEDCSADGYTQQYRMGTGAFTSGRTVTGTLTDDQSVAFRNTKSGTLPTGIKGGVFTGFFMMLAAAAFLFEKFAKNKKKGKV